MILSLLLITIILGLVPLLIGAEVTYLLKIPGGFIQSYVLGFFSVMAICEVIAVPCALFKSSFTLVLILFFVTNACIIVLAIIHKSPTKIWSIKKLFSSWKKFRWLEITALVALIAVLAIIIINSIRLHVIDEDDSRFVVTAADIMRTNKIFLTDPNTGITYSQWPYGVDVAKDIVAPHAVFCAIMAASTMTSAVVFMHTIYPVVLYVVATGVYYLLITELLNSSERIANDKHVEAYKFFFIAIIYLYVIYHFSTRATVQTVFLVRLWQGKAILASIIIPALIYTMMLIYNLIDNKSKIPKEQRPHLIIYLLVFVLAGCLTSSMATLLIPMILLVYGLAYGITKKSPVLMLRIWSTALPCIFLALLSMYIRNEMLLC